MTSPLGVDQSPPTALPKNGYMETTDVEQAEREVFCVLCDSVFEYGSQFLFDFQSSSPLVILWLCPIARRA